MTMNFAVHSVMYSYFALRAMKYKLPNWVPMVVTSLQLIQMVMAVVINLLVYQVINSKCVLCNEN